MTTHRHVGSPGASHAQASGGTLVSGWACECRTIPLAQIGPDSSVGAGLWAGELSTTNGR